LNHAKNRKRSKVHRVAAAAVSALAPRPDVQAQTAAPAVAPQSPVTPPGDLPPAVGAPATPKGWKATPTKGRGKTKGQRLANVQVRNQRAAGKELAASTTYTTDFGQYAPSQSALGFLLTNAAAWRALWEGASLFLDYCAEQRKKWEHAAATEMATFKPSFDVVTSRKPAVADNYAATAKYLTAKSASAKRSAATRKTKDKAKAKKAGGKTVN
jgi:hypothetical protein